MDKIIICSNSYKEKLLLKENNNLSNNKYMTKSEFFNNYFYKYDDKTIYYLMKKYNINIDIAHTFLESMYVIDINKNYNNSKLDKLVSIKKDLINNNLLYFNNYFKEYIKDKKIEVKSIYDLEKYEEEILNIKRFDSHKEIRKDIIICNTIEEEVLYVILEIIKLLNNNIDINKIYLTNVSKDYYYILEKLFSYFNIPINIKSNQSIISTKVVQDYLNNKEIDIEDNNKLFINKELINIIDSLVDLEDDNIKNEILKYKLNHTMFKNELYDNAVNIKDLYSEEFYDDEYVFVLGFNSDTLPKTYKDINYLSDNLSNLVNIYTTTYKNKYQKIVLSNVLSNIKNLYLSFSKRSPFKIFYLSSFIDEKIKKVEFTFNNFSYSNIYNKIYLTNLLDMYSLYGIKNDNINKLYSKYDILYKTYSNKYTNINKDLFLNNISYPYRLSYTSINTYNECRFKYYIKNVLKLDDFESNFSATIGSFYHYILSIYKQNNFDFEKEIHDFFKDKDLSLKEVMLLNKIKDELNEFINILNNQDDLTEYNNNLLEHEFIVNIKSDIKIDLVGYIDKILFLKKLDDTYFSVIDYKTGNINTNLELVKYGLNMQLVIYLYLVINSNYFSNPIFTGIYYQNILFSYPTYKKDVEKEIEKRYLLKGYSTNVIDILSKFDKTYKDSRLIKSMKYSNDKFSRFSKILNDEDLFDLLKYTKKILNEVCDNIIETKFDINPKVYNNKNISCNYCKYKSICYMTNNDLIYLDKVEDLSFIKGE